MTKPDLHELRTVCVFLGPYRNLTTLTAAVLHLHPFCQVLNHAGSRILGVPELDFLVDRSEATFARFCEFALSASQTGQRGRYGGSITYSHAFDGDLLRETHRRRYGNAMTKGTVQAIVWKESLRVSQRIREQRVDLGGLLDGNERVRFLMPVRHPLDCALSNIRTGHAAMLCTGGPPDVREVAAAVLAELAWFRELARRHGPGAFLSFFEFEVGEALLTRVRDFLRLDPDERWMQDALGCFRVKAGYAHDPALVAWYRERVRHVFANDPEFAGKLERFAS
jgi:hypothetical protein